MIDAPKLRACPLSEIKLANRAGDGPVRTLLVVAASGCVIRRTPTRCPIFFTHPLTLRFSVFGGRVSGYRQLEKESDTGTRERRRRVDFRNYETPLAPGDPSVGGGAHGAVRLRQCHFNYAC